MSIVAMPSFASVAAAASPAAPAPTTSAGTCKFARGVLPSILAASEMLIAASTAVISDRQERLSAPAASSASPTSRGRYEWAASEVERPNHPAYAWRRDYL